MDEVDIFDKNGVQVDDINTVYEYINQIILNHKPQKPHPDEDDDQAHYFNVIKFQNFNITQYVINGLKKNIFGWSEKPVYTFFRDKKLLSPTQDVVVPPPKA